jgi:hypothetical protein
MSDSYGSRSENAGNGNQDGTHTNRNWNSTPERRTRRNAPPIAAATSLRYRRPACKALTARPVHPCAAFGRIYQVRTYSDVFDPNPTDSPPHSKHATFPKLRKAKKCLRHKARMEALLAAQNLSDVNTARLHSACLAHEHGPPQHPHEQPLVPPLPAFPAGAQLKPKSIVVLNSTLLGSSFRSLVNTRSTLFRSN